MTDKNADKYLQKKHKKRERGHYTVTKEKKHRRRRRKCNIMGFIIGILTYMRIYFDNFIDWLFGFFMKSSKQTVPALKEKFLLESATSLAKKIREGKLTSEKLVQACIDRINEANPIINAVVNNRFELAIAEAKEIDKKIANNVYTKEDFEKKPFLGVPFTTKESTACKGLKWTFGLVCRKYIVAEEDAEVVKLMKEAGGILLGNTNIPQLNLWTESYNPNYGRTNNPYDSTRNVGGSSGGEGAIIAACGSPIGIGTDIGGSIRIPAFMCGVFGHKPTCDLISTKGLTFRQGNEGPSMVAAGPMARYSQDLKTMLKVLLGNNVDKLTLDKPVDKLRVFYCPDFDDFLPSKQTHEMRDIMISVVEYLKDKSVDAPKEVLFDKLSHATKLYNFWIQNEPGFNFNRDITNKKGHLSFLSGLISFLSLSEEYCLHVIYVLGNLILPKKDPTWAKEITEELRKEIMDLLGDDGVLLFPSSPWPASYHYTSYLRPWNVTYTSIWNFLKLPVTQIPLGLGEEGLPLGIQVVAAPNQDHLCLEVAKYLEENMGGFVPPCPVEE